MPIHTQAAAAEGPISIVNVALRRSDIIILRHNGPPLYLMLCMDNPLHKPLPEGFDTFGMKIWVYSRTLFAARSRKDIIVLCRILLPYLGRTGYTHSWPCSGLQRMELRAKSRIWWRPGGGPSPAQPPIYVLFPFTQPAVCRGITSRHTHSPYPPSSMQEWREPIRYPVARRCSP